MDNQLNNDTQFQFQEEPDFWDDDLNKLITISVVLILLLLAWKIKPWRLLLPTNSSVGSITVSNISDGVGSATSMGLSVGEMVKML